MDIGVPKEVRQHEKRVGITPGGVRLLVRKGHRVFVQSGAGEGCGFLDEHYQAVGAEIVFDAGEAYGRADVVLKVTGLIPEEYELLRESQVIFAFFHLAAAARQLVDTLLKKEITAVAYETVQNPDGELPILVPMSEIAGRMAPAIASHCLSTPAGGKGILLAGIPGVPAAEVVIIGGGVVGYNAARSFLGIGAHVTLLDRKVSVLQRLDSLLGGHLNTMIATRHNITRVCRYLDVLVGCILLPGARTPHVVTEEMVRSMRRRSVILDIAIDQGGCVETSHPTTLGDPTYISEGIIHYCVPNMPGRASRTSSHALTNASVPFLLDFLEAGEERALVENRALAAGVNTYRGHLVNESVAASTDMEAVSLESILGATKR
jgi:alanine dehydrogenase